MILRILNSTTRERYSLPSMGTINLDNPEVKSYLIRDDESYKHILRALKGVTRFKWNEDRHVWVVSFPINIYNIQETYYPYCRICGNPAQSPTSYLGTPTIVPIRQEGNITTWGIACKKHML